MSRAVPLRLTIGLALLPIGALLSAQCGGNDVIDAADASTDSTFDGVAVDVGADTNLADQMGEASPDVTQPPDSGADGDAGLNNPEGGLADGADAIAADAGDAADARMADTGAIDARVGDADATVVADAAMDADAAINLDAALDVDAAINLDAAIDVDAAIDADAAMDGEAGPEGGSLIAPSLGSARTFAVLAGMTITNTGTTTAITGDVGIWPGAALVGLPAGQVNGTIHLGDAVAQQAEADLTTAYNNAAGRPCGTVMTSIDLGGKTLPPGVYCFASSAGQMSGDLTLDGQGDPNGVWIFQIASTLTVSTNVSTFMINGGNACNVYWQVGSAATIGTGAQFKGNILAQASITLNNGANVSPGRTLAQTASVTMQSSAISNAGCP